LKLRSAGRRGPDGPHPPLALRTTNIDLASITSQRYKSTMLIDPWVPLKFVLLLYGGICIFGLLFFAFWIWMIVDCATNEPPGGDKVVWMIIVVCLNWIGATVYYFARRRNRAKGQFFPPKSPPPPP
jgi:hypothetical protein